MVRPLDLDSNLSLSFPKTSLCVPQRISGQSSACPLPVTVPCFPSCKMPGEVLDFLLLILKTGQEKDILFSETPRGEQYTRWRLPSLHSTESTYSKIIPLLPFVLVCTSIPKYFLFTSILCSNCYEWFCLIIFIWTLVSRKRIWVFIDGIRFPTSHLSFSSVTQQLSQCYNLSGICGVLLSPQYCGLSIKTTKDNRHLLQYKDPCFVLLLSGKIADAFFMWAIAPGPLCGPM